MKETAPRIICLIVCCCGGEPTLMNRRPIGVRLKQDPLLIASVVFRVLCLHLRWKPGKEIDTVKNASPTANPVRTRQKSNIRKPPPRANCDVERRPRWQTERRLLTVFDILWHHFSSPIYLLPSFGRGLIMSFLESTFPPSNTWGPVTPRPRRSSPMWLKVTLEPSRSHRFDPWQRWLQNCGCVGSAVQWVFFSIIILFFILSGNQHFLFNQLQLLLYSCIIFFINEQKNTFAMNCP